LFLLGGQKAGSTSLFDSLATHLSGTRRPVPLQGDPQFFDKEVHFFDIPERAEKGLKAYTEYYGQCSDPQTLTVAMDGTPNYLQDYAAPQRARIVLRCLSPTEQKRLVFVVVIRDPVDRFVSWVS
jgi:hypothetical protein